MVEALLPRRNRAESNLGRGAQTCELITHASAPLESTAARLGIDACRLFASDPVGRAASSRLSCSGGYQTAGEHHDPNMHAHLAHRLILHKLLEEWFEGRYRGRIKQFHFKNVKTGESETVVG